MTPARTRSIAPICLCLLAGATGCAAPSQAPATASDARSVSEPTAQVYAAAPPRAAPPPAAAPVNIARGGQRVDEALADLDRAERLIVGALGASPAKKADAAALDEADSTTTTRRERASTTASPPKGSPAPQAGASPAGATGAGGYSEARGCTTACPALASMRRAADSVCRLVGEDDERCRSARARVAASTDRVASCACAPSP